MFNQSTRMEGFMKIDIIMAYMPRYRWGHEMNFVPPLTAIHLAALTPAKHRVRVFHQQVDPLPMESDADLVAFSFFSGFAPEAYALASFYQSRGKYLVAGGPHVTFSPQEALAYFDTIICGEAENVWETFLDQFERGHPQQVYQGKSSSLKGLPTPRYDLLSASFVTTCSLRLLLSPASFRLPVDAPTPVHFVPSQQ